MAYWLVYQGSSFKRSRAGGYLWAPQRNKDGRGQFYWENMTRLQTGDLVFSGFDGAVRALSYVEGPPRAASGPDPEDAKSWYGIGWQADVSYVDLPAPLRYTDWVPAIRSALPARYGPFDKNNQGNQGYLFELPDAVGEHLIKLARRAGVDIALRALEAAPVPPAKQTQRESTVLARIGQGQFRDSLLTRWEGKCAVTGLDRRELLRASHVKPWSACNDQERLDGSNGLLLSAAYDSAFDALLITFDDSGKIEFAPDFTADTAARAGISATAAIRLVDTKLREYLAVHRELVAARVAASIGQLREVDAVRDHALLAVK